MQKLVGFFGRHLVWRFVAFLTASLCVGVMGSVFVGIGGCGGSNQGSIIDGTSHNTSTTPASTGGSVIPGGSAGSTGGDIVPESTAGSGTGGAETTGGTTGGVSTGGATGGIAEAACGNGTVESGEGCDDGQNPPTDGDGCSHVCQVESGWTCSSGAPSTCKKASEGDVSEPPTYDFAYTSNSHGNNQYRIFLDRTGTSDEPKLLLDNDTAELPSNLSFSSDGKYLLYGLVFKVGDPSQFGEIHVLDVAKAIATKNTGDKKLDTDNDPSYFPAYTSDSSKIIYATGASGCGLLRRMNTDGSNKEEEAGQMSDSARYGHLSVSPVTDSGDPSYNKMVLTFNEDAGHKNTDLYMKDYGNNDPSQMVNLTSTPGDSEFDPAISPDGKKLAFCKNLNLAVCDLQYSPTKQCTNVKVFTSIGGTDQRPISPAWSYDGKRIFYSASGDIWSVKADGTNAVNHTNSPDADEGFPAVKPLEFNIKWEMVPYQQYRQMKSFETMPQYNRRMKVLTNP